MWFQNKLDLFPSLEGHLATVEMLTQLPELKDHKIGAMKVFIRHTSASLTINEYAKPEVRLGVESYINHAVPGHEPYYRYLDKGSDVHVLYFQRYSNHASKTV